MEVGKKYGGYVNMDTNGSQLLQTEQAAIIAPFVLDAESLLEKTIQPLRILNQHRNGIQHYEPIDFAGRGEKWAQKQLKNIQNADLFKSKYLKSHDIPQLIIPYWEFNNIEYYIIEFIKELSTKYELKNKS